jgi:hypothetical protein
MFSSRGNKLFIHIPKNGGISIKTVLQEKYSYPFDGHYTCQQMKAKSILNNFTYEEIFSTCRNPFSRMVSVYFSLQRKMKLYSHYFDNLDLTIPFKYYSFSHFVEFFLKQNNLNFHYMNTYMFLPQHTWLDTSDNVKIFKIEEISKIEKYLNCKMPHHNKHLYKKPWVNLYDEESQKIVYTHYEKDFETFKYLKKIPI